MGTYHLCIGFTILIFMVISERATANRGDPEKTTARAKVDKRQNLANGPDAKELKSKDLIVIMFGFT